MCNWWRDAGERDASIHRVPQSNPLLVREHIYFAEEDVRLLYGINVFRGDCYRYRFQAGDEPLRSQASSFGPQQDTPPFQRTE